ncbi:MAG: hypothetical protein EA353_04635 [Puniceicoccaceae bacterium]|nr:MAG: hypothetical protein EA353_04635 [Puniceicoccaceae bacterium]
MPPQTEKSRMNQRIFRIALVALATFAFVLSTNAKLDTSDEMASQTRWVVNTINARHYLRGSMEALDGKEMVEAYVRSFDNARMHFTRPEVDDFVFRFADAMEAFLKKGNLYAAFEIHDSFKAKVEARTEWAFERLKEDFDFTIDETFQTDRREADWPADKAAADDLWLQRLKYELLNEMLSLASETREGGNVSINVENPDAAAPSAGEEDAAFDPSKLLRLLEDEDFYAETLDEAREKIRRRYERSLSRTLAREAPEVQESFINAMTQLFDPHSSFLSSDTLESFQSSVQNSFVGIGAMLEDDDGICTIKEILPGGPAERSRLLGPNDQILGVAQGDEEFEDVVDMQLRYIVRKIKGEKGTIVRLLIRPGDATDPSVRKIVPIERDEVKLTANLAKARLIEVPNESGDIIPVGVIELPSFYGNIGAGGTLSSTSEDVTELLNKLRESGAEGIILDLRMNGGGLLSEAVRVAGLFIPVGPIVQVRDSSGRRDVLADRDPSMLWDGPLIVLTSRFSASASEIVAGALQDHKRALIVGNSSTHGKGTVQEVYHMNNRPAFSLFRSQEPQARPVASKITIKQFYLPQGSSTQVRGVPSDIALPSVNEFLPIGEDDLPHALPWGAIDPVDWVNDWKKLNVASPEDPALIEHLALASQARQESLEEFQFLHRQIEWRRQRFEEKEVSVHLENRIQRKIKERAYIEKLDAIYKDLSAEDYNMQAFLLKISEEQDAQSRENLSRPRQSVNAGQSGAVDSSSPDQASTEPAVEIVSVDEDNEEDEPTFDIYLRESARIMADWVKTLQVPERATASFK